MATKTFEELRKLAIQIRDEKANKQNTALRIGNFLLSSLDKMESMDIADIAEAVLQAETAADEAKRQADIVAQSGDIVEEAIKQGAAAEAAAAAANAAADKATNEGLFKTQQDLSEEEQGQVKRNLGIEDLMASLETQTIEGFSETVNATTSTKSVDNIIPPSIDFAIVDLGSTDGRELPTTPSMSVVLAKVTDDGRVKMQGYLKTSHEEYNIQVVSGSAEKYALNVNIITDIETTYKVFQIRYLSTSDGGKFKGSYGELSQLQAAYPTAGNGSYAFVGNPRHLYEWVTNAWTDRGEFITNVDQAIDAQSERAVSNKAVSAKLTELDNKATKTSISILSNKEYKVENGGYFPIGEVSEVVTSSPTVSGNYKNIELDCKEYKYLYLDVLQNQYVKSWAFIDSDRRIISCSDSVLSDTFVKKILDIPAKADIAVINTVSSYYEKSSVIIAKDKTKFEELNLEILELRSEDDLLKLNIEKLKSEIFVTNSINIENGGYFPIGEIGSALQVSPNGSSSYKNTEIKCKEGSKIIVEETTYSQYVNSWCFIDENRNILLRSDPVTSETTLKDLLLTAPTNSVKFVINRPSTKESSVKIITKDNRIAEVEDKSKDNSNNIALNKVLSDNKVDGVLKSITLDIVKGGLGTNYPVIDGGESAITDYYKIQPNLYYISTYVNIYFYDYNKQFISKSAGYVTKAPSNAYFAAFAFPVGFIGQKQMLIVCDSIENDVETESQGTNYQKYTKALGNKLLGIKGNTYSSKTIKSIGTTILGDSEASNFNKTLGDDVNSNSYSLSLGGARTDAIQSYMFDGKSVILISCMAIVVSGTNDSSDEEPDRIMAYHNELCKKLRLAGVKEIYATCPFRATRGTGEQGGVPATLEDMRNNKVYQAMKAYYGSHFLDTMTYAYLTGIYYNPYHPKQFTQPAIGGTVEIAFDANDFEGLKETVFFEVGRDFHMQYYNEKYDVYTVSSINESSVTVTLKTNNSDRTEGMTSGVYEEEFTYATGKANKNTLGFIYNEEDKTYVDKGMLPPYIYPDHLLHFGKLFGEIIRNMLAIRGVLFEQNL